MIFCALRRSSGDRRSSRVRLRRWLLLRRRLRLRERLSQRRRARSDLGDRGLDLLQGREWTGDPRLAEVIRDLLVGQEPLAVGLLDAEALVGGPILAGGPSDEAVRVGGRTGLRLRRLRGSLLCGWHVVNMVAEREPIANPGAGETFCPPQASPIVRLAGIRSGILCVTVTEAGIALAALPRGVSGATGGSRRHQPAPGLITERGQRPMRLIRGSAGNRTDGPRPGTDHGLHPGP